MSTTYDDYEARAESAPGRFSQIKGAISTLVGALVALSLLMALGIWFYRLGVRDAASVPIIRAASEPTKVRPTDPGGSVAPHQDVTSYEVAEAGTAKAGAAVLAPAPVKPNRDDLAMGALQAKPEEKNEAQEADPEEKLAALNTDVNAQKPTEATDAKQDAKPDGADEKVAVAGSALAPAASPLAPRRPSDLIERSRAALAQKTDDAPALARQAETSTYQVQLAADPSESAMRAKWQKVKARNEDLLRGKTLALPTVKSGGTLFYRLRVGPFKNRSEAASVCQALKARGQDCIVAKNT